MPDGADWRWTFRVMDLALLLPPLARFFVGILLILIVVGGAVGFTAFIYNLYGEEE